MKLKRLLLGFLLALCSAATVFAVAGCDGGGADSSGDDSSGGSSQTYQFTGTMGGSDLEAAGRNYAFWLNLNADYTAVLSRYRIGSHDNSPAAENSAYEESYMSGSWGETVRDGVEGLSISLSVIDDDGSVTETKTATAYGNTNGVYTFTMNISVVSGQSYSRDVSFTGGTEVIYADADAFIADFYVAEEETDATAFTGTYNDREWTLTFDTETSCTISTTMGESNVPFTCSYSIDEDLICTLTLTQELSNEYMIAIWNGISGVQWQLDYDNLTMTPVEASAAE